MGVLIEATFLCSSSTLLRHFETPPERKKAKLETNPPCDFTIRMAMHWEGEGEKWEHGSSEMGDSFCVDLKSRYRLSCKYKIKRAHGGFNAWLYRVSLVVLLGWLVLSPLSLCVCLILAQHRSLKWYFQKDHPFPLWPNALCIFTINILPFLW